MRLSAPRSQRPLAKSPATFVAVSRSSTRSIVRVVLLVLLFFAVGSLGREMFAGAPLPHVLMVLTVLACMLVALAAPWKVFIRVAAEGVSLRNAAFPTSRFIPCSRLARVDVDRNDVWLTLNDGKRLGFRFPRKSEHLATELTARVVEILASHRSTAHPFAAVLGRGARSPEDWRRALAGQAPESAYREIAIPPASLLATVEDGEAPADVRVGAAIALRRAGLDEIGRARVRVAGQLSRDPKLRVSLTATAAGNDDEIAHAIDQFCDENAAGRT